jgi:ATP-dependent RNA helicase DDX27
MKLVTKAASLPVKARLIPPEIIGKYRDKLTALAEEIETVIEEEEAEKSLAKAEIEANKALKMVSETKTGSKKRKRGKGGSDLPPAGEKGRLWFQTSKERKDESDKLKKGHGPAQLRQQKKQAEDDKKLKKTVEFQARQAKRKRKGMKGGTETMTNGKSGGGKRGKKKSHFEDELTNVKSARQFRHQPKSFSNKNNNSKGKTDNKKGNTANGKKGMGMGNKSDRKFKQKFNKRK